MSVAVVPDKRKMIFPVSSPERARQLFPTSAIARVKDRYLCAVPHNDEFVRVLRNVGIKAPGEIRYYYEWSGAYTPREVQLDTAEFLTLHRRAFCLNAMGTGKTISSLWAYDYLRELGRVDKALVVCPLSTMTMTWANEIFRHFPHLRYQVLHGSRKKRLELLGQDADVYIINHDGLPIIAEKMAERCDINLIIYDELAVCRNASTKRWKVANEIINNQCGGQRWAWGLTGTPTPNEPVDAYAQVRLINPPRLIKAGYKTKTSFKLATMRQVSTYKWVPKDDAMQTVYRLMQPSIRYSLDDCVELPEEVFIEREPELSKEQDKAYREMWATLQAEAEEGSITAVNEAVKFNKLLQIACGSVYGDTDGEDERDIIDLKPKPRLEAMLEVIEESEGKVIVFVPFTNSIQMVKKYLTEKKISYRVITGQTSNTKRTEAFTSFKNDQDVRVLVAQPATMSHGLTLTEATTILWYGLTASNEIFEQANARVRRPGQTKKTAIVVFASTSVEKHLHKRLKDKQSAQGLLLKLVSEGGE